MATRSTHDHLLQVGPAQRTLLAAALRVVSVLILGAVHCHVLLRVASIAPSALASQRILDGLPHWRIYQSRVLGPLLMGSIERWSGVGYLPAYLLVVLLALCGLHALLWLLQARLGLTALRSSLLSIALIAGSALLVRHEWFYVWDALNLFFAAAFCVGALWPFRLGVLSVLFCAALLNHEIALCMPAWLVLLQLCEAARARRFTRRHALTCALALLTAFIGSRSIEWLRSTFLVREVGPEIFADYDARYADPSLQWHLWPNLGELWHALSALEPRALLGPALLALGYLLVRAARSPVPRVQALSLTFLALLGATLSIGLVFETRVYLVFLPYVLSSPLRAADQLRSPLGGAAGRGTGRESGPA